MDREYAITHLSVCMHVIGMPKSLSVSTLLATLALIEVPGQGNMPGLRLKLGDSLRRSNNLKYDINWVAGM